VTIKPKVTVKGQAKVSSKKLTVKKGNKTLAKNKSSVKLGKGTYKLTTTVKYRTYTTGTVTTQVVAPGATAAVTCTATNVRERTDYVPGVGTTTNGSEITGLSCQGANWGSPITAGGTVTCDINNVCAEFYGLKYGDTRRVSKAGSPTHWELTGTITPAQGITVETPSAAKYSATKTAKKTQTLKIKNK
jgi:hypothetical protein